MIAPALSVAIMIVILGLLMVALIKSGFGPNGPRPS